MGATQRVVSAWTERAGTMGCGKGCKLLLFVCVCPRGSALEPRRVPESFVPGRGAWPWQFLLRTKKDALTSNENPRAR
eukprot:3701004-Rhodomonas_salina.2